MLKLVGILFYIVAVADFAGMFFGYDFTGQSWTPILFGALGQLFFYIDGKANPESAEDSSEEN